MKSEFGGSGWAPNVGKDTPSAEGNWVNCMLLKSEEHGYSARDARAGP